MLSDLRLVARKKGFQISSLTPKQKFLTKNLKFVCYTIKNISNLKNAHYVLKESSLSLYDPIKLKFEENFEYTERLFDKKEKIYNFPASKKQIFDFITKNNS